MLTAVSPEKFGAVRPLQNRPSPNVADLAEGGVVRHPDRAHQHSVSSFRIDETGIATVRRWHGEHVDCTARFSLFLIAANSVVLTHSSANVRPCGNPLPALGRSGHPHESFFAVRSDGENSLDMSSRATSNLNSRRESDPMDSEARQLGGSIGCEDVPSHLTSRL